MSFSKTSFLKSEYERYCMFENGKTNHAPFIKDIHFIRNCLELRINQYSQIFRVKKTSTQAPSK